MPVDIPILPSEFVKLAPRIPVLISKLPLWCERVLQMLLIWVLVGLVWWVLSPAPAISNLSMPVQYSAAQRQDVTALRKWFEASQVETAAAPVPDLTLIAVIAGQRGVALIGGVEASAVAVQVGSEIRPGTRLLAVLPDHIVIERNGTKQNLNLPAPATSGVSLNNAPVLAGGPIKGRSDKPADKISRGQITAGVQGENLASWDKGLSSHSDGGIKVDDASIQPLAKLLKLQNGDVLKRINDRELKQLADISLVFNAITKFTDVELTLLRNGSLQTQRYQITP